MARVVIGLAGLKGSGKDTVADFLVNRHGFVKYAFAGPLKEATLQYLRQTYGRNAASRDFSVRKSGASSTNGSSPGSQVHKEGDKMEHVLPSETTDTEPWSTHVDMLHERNAPKHPASASRKTTKDAAGVPANLHSLIEDHAGIAAEPTISMTSKDDSPDRSSLRTG